MNQENYTNENGISKVTFNQESIYQKIHSVYQAENCTSIAFTHNNSLMAAGCGEKIKIYKFNDSFFQLLQILERHTRRITVLQFIGAHLISGDYDGRILYWSQEGNYQYEFTPTHNDFITCIDVNREENLIITADDSSEIKIWKQNGVWKCCQIITFRDFFSVYQMSLNLNSNQFVACGSNQFIIYYLDQKWRKLQKVKCSGTIYRSCFITDTIFATQQESLNMIELFQSSEKSKLFFKLKIIQVNCEEDCKLFFPMQFIQKKQIIVSKHGRSINIIQKKQNNQFELLQVIPLRSEVTFGSMTKDGDYMVFWTSDSKEIQVWKSIQ